MKTTIKRLISDIWALGLLILGKLSPANINSGQLTILMFHRCLPETLRSSYPYKGLAITPEELDWLLTLLKQHFHILPVTQATNDFLGNTPNQVSVSDKKPLLALSFDDGQWDNLEYAHPVLAKHGLSATFYIPTQPVEQQQLIWHDLVSFGAEYIATQGSQTEQEMWRTTLPEYSRALQDNPVELVESLKNTTPEERESICKWLTETLPTNAWPEWARMMTWKQVSEMHELGHEIGSHCITHQLLPQLDSKQVRQEIVESKSIIEEACGISIGSLCYPNGDYDQRCLLAAKEAGYSNAVTTQWGLSETNTHAYTLLRMDVDPFQHLNAFGKMSKAKTLMRITNQLPSIN